MDTKMSTFTFQNLEGVVSSFDGKGPMSKYWLEQFKEMANIFVFSGIIF